MTAMRLTGRSQLDRPDEDELPIVNEKSGICKEGFQAGQNLEALDEVREILHDGCPVACLGDVPFGCVNVFTSHVNVGILSRCRLTGAGSLVGRYGQVHASYEADGE